MKTISPNLLERALWTLAQAGLGVVTVVVTGLPVAYAPVVALVLSAAKTYIQEHLNG